MRLHSKADADAGLPPRSGFVQQLLLRLIDQTMPYSASFAWNEVPRKYLNAL